MAKKKQKFLNKYLTQPEKGKIIKGEPMTIQDQAYTVKELIRRYQHGIHDPLERPHFYSPDGVTHDDLDLGEVHRMDIGEKREVQQELYENTNQLKLDVEAQKAEAKAKREAKKAAKQQEEPAPENPLPEAEG